MRCLVCEKTDITEGYWCPKCDRLGINNHTVEQMLKLSKTAAAEARKQLGVVEWKKCAADILYWLTPSRHLKTKDWPEGIPYVYSHDPHPMYWCLECNNDVMHRGNALAWHLEHQHDIISKDPIQVFAHFNQFPTVRPFVDLGYFEPIIKTWLQRYLVLVEKSRDMMATWLVVMMHAWDVFYHEGRQHIFQSEDAPKALELVKRAQFIYEHQPKFLKRFGKIKFASTASKSGMLRVEQLNSEILGFPQGPDQVRQYHPTGLFQDEAAFQIQAGAAFAAAKPAIQNGGRFTAISSANPGWFQRACQDTLSDYEE